MSELVTIKNLSIKLQQNTILSDINLTLSSGDILGLVGPSGCGKTTLLNTIAGFIAQSEGTITLTKNNSKTLIITAQNLVPPEHRNVGMIFQDYALFPHLTVAKNICFGINKEPKPVQNTQLETLLKLLKLEGLAPRYPHQLSGGQQQRVAIARALAPKPALLLLDEPFSNIDARLRNDLMIELRSLLKTLNTTAIFVTHNKDEVFSFGDKIAVMAQGKILQTGLPSEVCKKPNSWQVADFLQLGSWLPVVAIPTNNQTTISYNSALGVINAPLNTIKEHTNNQLVLLIKSHNITLCTGAESSDANATIKQISVTEQGFNYQCSSLDTTDELLFSKLSFYSHELLKLGQNISLKINIDALVAFNIDEVA